jgi:hypothetical protein
VTRSHSTPPPWDDAPAWQRDSAIDGVTKALGGVTPEELHQAWCDAKVAEGWTHGDVRDPNARTHPCLLPYDQLPDHQRVKDAVFTAIVAALTSSTITTTTTTTTINIHLEGSVPAEAELVELVRDALRRDFRA